MSEHSPGPIEVTHLNAGQLRYKPRLGTTIQQVSALVVEVANRTGLSVAFKINDRAFLIHPETEPEAIIASYLKAAAIRKAEGSETL